MIVYIARVFVLHAHEPRIQRRRLPPGKVHTTAAYTEVASSPPSLYRLYVPFITQAMLESVFPHLAGVLSFSTRTTTDAVLPCSLTLVAPIGEKIRAMAPCP